MLWFTVALTRHHSMEINIPDRVIGGGPEARRKRAAKAASSKAPTVDLSGFKAADVIAPTLDLSGVKVKKPATKKPSKQEQKGKTTLDLSGVKVKSVAKKPAKKKPHSGTSDLGDWLEG